MVDIHGYISYGDPGIVAKLIKERSQIDTEYDGGAVEPGILESGTSRVMEDVQCVYIDLDRLIDTAGLSPNERRIVDGLMLGYSISEIAELHHVTRQTVSVEFNRAVEKICEENNRLWLECYSDVKASERPDLRA